MASLPICWFAEDSGGDMGCDRGEGAVRRAGSAALAAAFPGVDVAAPATGAFVDMLDCILPELPCL